MKSSVSKQPLGATCACGVLAGLLALLLWVPLASAGGRQTAEIKATMVGFSQGEWALTPGGNLRIRGVAQVLKFESNNSWFSGRFTWEGDANVDGALNGIAVCKNTFEVGTWDQEPDSGEWVFTPSAEGGMFVGVVLATGNLLGPFELKGEAHGIAGELEGLNIRIEGQGDSLFAEQSYTVESLDPKAKN